MLNEGSNNQFIQSALKKVPIVKFALGILAITIFISSIIKVFNSNLRVAAWSIFIMLSFMIILFLISNFIKAPKFFFNNQIRLLAWSIAILFVIVLSLIVFSIFFNYPLRLCSWIDPNCSKSSTTQIILDSSTNHDSIKNDSITIKPRVFSSSKHNPKKSNDFIVSLQLPEGSAAYNYVYVNDVKVNLLPESTRLNPRILLNNLQLPAAIIVINHSGDTCSAVVSRKPDQGIFRILLNCNP